MPAEKLPHLGGRVDLVARPAVHEPVDRLTVDVPEGLVFGYPVRSKGGSWSIAEDFELDDFAKEKIRITTEELVAERDEVQSLLS